MLKKVLVLLLLIAVMVPSYAVMGMEEEDEPQSPKVFIPKEMISEDELLEDFMEDGTQDNIQPQIVSFSMKVNVCKWTTFTGSLAAGFMGGPIGVLAGMVVGSYMTAYCAKIMN